jgi:hypothetical protein
MYDICFNSLIYFVQVQHRSGVETSMIIFDVHVCRTSPTFVVHLNDYPLYILFEQVCVKKHDNKHVSRCNIVIKINTSMPSYGKLKHHL